MATRRKASDAGAEREEEAEAKAAKAGESIGLLLRGIVAESTSLVRQEIELARAEFSEKVALVQRYATAMAVGGALLACAFFFLLSSLDRGVTAALATRLDKKSTPEIRGQAQGFLVFITYGVGMLIGAQVAGYVFNQFLAGSTALTLLQWRDFWWIPAGFAAAVALFFGLFFRDRQVEKLV